MHLLQSVPQVVLYAILLLEILLFFGLLVFLYTILSPLIKGAPNFPTQKDRLNTMIEFAKLSKKDKTVDLGSGDGTILMAVAKRGFSITGLEIDPFAVRKSRKRMQELGLEHLVTVRRSNFWRKNLSEFNVIFVYGINYIMKDLEKKLRQELKPGSRIISNRYEFPHLKPVRKKNNVLLYIV